MFAERIVGLQTGTIVYDGAPDGMTPAVLTQIYGEEDWEATIRTVDEEADGDEPDATKPSADADHGPTLDRDRLAGAT
jgi:hypothetical protein